MKFAGPLIGGRLIQRYKRFLADIRLDDGAVITAHVANPGAMTGLAEAGARVFLSRHADPKRKLPYSWELVAAGDGLVCVNTMHANRIAEEAILAGRIAQLRSYPRLRREVAYGDKSRVDFLLSGDGQRDCYVEVKAVTLRQDQAACFPDAVTERGARHLGELARRVRSGDRAVMLFLVMRQDCAEFRCAGWIDPAYRAALHRARAEGVETLCYACQIDVMTMTIGAALPIVLEE